MKNEQPREHRRKDDREREPRHFHARSMKNPKTPQLHCRYAGKGCWNEPKWHSRRGDGPKHNRRAGDQQ